MQFHFVLMEEEDARAILTWRYEGQYAIYNREEDDDPTALSCCILKLLLYMYSVS